MMLRRGATTGVPLSTSVPLLTGVPLSTSVPLLTGVPLSTSDNNQSASVVNDLMPVQCDCDSNNINNANPNLVDERGFTKTITTAIKYWWTIKFSSRSFHRI